MKKKYNVVIPVHKSDMDLLKISIPYIIKNLKPNLIIIISSKELKNDFTKWNNVMFMEEDKILDGLKWETISKLLKERCGSDRRAGWYFQQFLKMAYAYRCEEKCYLLWDADTIPLREIEFIEKNHYVLDLKDEYNKPYFRTMKKLIGISKVRNESFIAEHMIIDKKIMIELITYIEKNDRVRGNVFYEKIIEAIPKNDLQGNGFSEYETYGSYVTKFYSKYFQYRRLKSLRAGKILLGENPNKQMLDWASKSFDTISIEKNHQQDRLISGFCKMFFLRFIKLSWIWTIYKKIKSGVYYD